MVKKKSKTGKPFDAGVYLQTAGVKRKIVQFRKGQAIFSQGDTGHAVHYLQAGSVKITVDSSAGKEAIVALLGPGDFFGEGCISGQPLRVSTATAMGPVSASEIEREEMIRVLHEEHDFSDRFVAHMLKRNVRIEEDLVDQLFNSSEKRLARALLLIARYGNTEGPLKIVAKASHRSRSDPSVKYQRYPAEVASCCHYKGGFHISSYSPSS